MYRGGSAGYDRNITIFSPEGRLFQIEYASKAATPSNSLSVTSRNKNTICSVIVKKSQKKIEFKSLFKIFPLGDFTGCIFNGLFGDIQMQIKEIINEFVKYQYKFNSQIPIDYLAKRISDKNQLFTQFAYMRPLCIKTVFLGIDDESGPQIYKCDPSGYCSSHQICIIGEKATNLTDKMIEKTKKILTKSFTWLSTTIITISLLQNMLKMDIKSNEIEIVLATKQKILFKQLDEKDVEKVLNCMEEIL